MTRLRFLLVSFFGAVAACFGFDRERLARRWLARNGFVITECEKKSEWGVHCRVVVNHSKLGTAGARMMSSSVRLPNVASSYMDYLARHDFTIEEKHEVSELSCKPNDGWDDISIKTTQLAPPTIHRFPRPWWA